MPIVARGAALRPAAIAAALVLAFGACGQAPSASPPATSSAGLPSGAPTASGDAGVPPTCPPIPPVVAPGPWSTGVFYEAFVRSFADSNGDGIGDFAGMTAKLDYLNDGSPDAHGDLGVTGLWLMPVAEATSYHGYDVIDYDSVEKDYGTSASFKALVDAAHQRGIRVIVDFVPNHTGIDNPWFQDALRNGTHRDWYVWSTTDPGWSNPNGGASPWHAAGGAYYYGVFWEGMPDLNLRNPAVTAELEKVARHWLDDFGVDGIRIDAAKHLIEDGPNAQVNTPETHAWLSAFRADLHADRPDALVVGEVWEPRLVSAGYVRDGSLDMAFDFGIGPTIISSVNLGDGPSLTANQAEIATAYAPGLAGTFLSNHDQDRSLSQLHGDVGAAKQAAEALVLGPGVPFVYYGEEIGMPGRKPDPDLRTPFPWTSSGPGHGFTTGTPWEAFAPGAETTNVQAETADPASLLSTYRDVIRLRSQHRALGPDGTFSAVTTSRQAVAAAVRSFAGETLLVLQNLGPDPLSGVSLDLASGPLCGTPTASVLYASPSAPASVVAPAVTSTGGFAGYVPVAELAPRATIVIALGR